MGATPGASTIRLGPVGPRSWQAARVDTPVFAWDADSGSEAAPRTPVRRRNFTFPFAGTQWDTLAVDTIASIGFDAGVTIGRFDQLRTAASALVNETPAICVVPEAPHVRSARRQGTRPTASSSPGR
jgi:hypothetical protein